MNEQASRWDYGDDEDGDPVEVEIVDCKFNQDVQKRIDKPTNLTEISL